MFGFSIIFLKQDSRAYENACKALDLQHTNLPKAKKCSLQATGFSILLARSAPKKLSNPVIALWDMYLEV